MTLLFLSEKKYEKEEEKATDEQRRAVGAGLGGDPPLHGSVVRDGENGEEASKHEDEVELEDEALPAVARRHTRR